MKKIINIVLLLAGLNTVLIHSQIAVDLLGDVNSDGNIDILDIMRTIDIILEIPTVPGEDELWASDVNVDDLSNIIDLVLIVENILGIDHCPPLEFGL